MPLRATYRIGGIGITSGDSRRGIGRYVESILVAVLLGLASAVPVAWALQSGPDQFGIEAVGWHPLGTGQAFALSFGAVVPAALLGGAIGGLVWPSRPVVAPVAALFVAWFIGIVALPIVATVFDIPLRAGIFCFDACRARLSDGDVLAGVVAYGESLVGALVAFYLLAVPLVLFMIARRVRHAALWVAGLLSAHAAIHMFSIADAFPIYILLVTGILLWTLWLFGRDAGWWLFARAARRWTIVVGVAALVIATTWGAAAASWVPTVPLGVQGQLLGTATVEGFNPPDPSDWFPQIEVPRTPAGSGCFDSVVRPAGKLEICWEAYRDNREHLPGADYYQLRLVATLHAAGPSSWAWISITPIGGERTSVRQLWPSGVLDGPCRSAAVEGMNFLTNGDMTNDVASDFACGRTTAARADTWKRHWVIWTCAVCGADEPSGRRIAIRQLTATAQGNVPSWQIFAEVGQ